MTDSEIAKTVLHQGDRSGDDDVINTVEKMPIHVVVKRVTSARTGNHSTTKCETGVTETLVYEESLKNSSYTVLPHSWSVKEQF